MTPAAPGRAQRFFAQSGERWALLAASIAVFGCSAAGDAGREPSGNGGNASVTPGAGGSSARGGSAAGGAPSTANGGSTIIGQSGSPASGGQPAASGGTSGASSAAGGRPPSSGLGGIPTVAVPPPVIGSFAVLVPPGAVGAADPSCGVQSFKRERKPAEVILVLDRSASMQDPPEGGTLQKWDLVEPAVTGVVRSTDASISWGLKLYPEGQDTDSCAAASIVPLIHVPIAANNATAVIAAVTATDPEGDGTPTGDAVKFATAHLSQRGNDNPKYILLATDGDPSCPSGGDAATTYAVTAIADALTAGFPTFVVGVDTSKTSSITRLNAMAMAGGRPRPITATNAVAFYLASTQADLGTALQTITGEVASCVFSLTPPPPVPDNIAVDFSGQRTVRDPARLNGWEYTSPDHTSLEVYGSWCERIKLEAMNQVEIKYGCPNQPIPVPS